MVYLGGHVPSPSPRLQRSPSNPTIEALLRHRGPARAPIRGSPPPAPRHRTEPLLRPVAVEIPAPFWLHLLGVSPTKMKEVPSKHTDPFSGPSCPVFLLGRVPFETRPIKKGCRFFFPMSTGHLSYQIRGKLQEGGHWTECEFGAVEGILPAELGSDSLSSWFLVSIV